MKVLSAGLLASSLSWAVGITALVAVLAALVAWIIRPVVKKTRSEDVPAALVGLSCIIGALSCFLPWGKWRNVPGQAPVLPAVSAADGQPGATTATAPTISINAGQLAVLQPLLPQRDGGAGQLPAGAGGNQQ
ncbi:hypothetical protein [Streptomyces sp. NBC_01205]|uniref:hypothetical protein n=1 Tax=Streptomyces sp. NBC_01205 TaxID=2903771 RepID=UPI002E0D73DC|nr:hypothetical protein OG573_42960 [Streptomyces sp. NBC_01205]